MNRKSNLSKPGPKRSVYRVDDPVVNKIAGIREITTVKQYQRLRLYINTPLASREPCVRLGATVPPSPQMARNSSLRLKVINQLEDHDIEYSVKYNPPRSFVFNVHQGKITEALLSDLKNIEGATVTVGETVDQPIITVWADAVDDNKRSPSHSVWAVTYPGGKVEIIKRVQDPRAAHRWMTNEQRPWNSRIALEPVALAEI